MEHQTNILQICGIRRLLHITRIDTRCVIRYNSLSLFGLCRQPKLLLYSLSSCIFSQDNKTYFIKQLKECQII